MGAGVQDGQHQAGEASPGAHIHHGLPLEGPGGQEGGAVQEVPPHHLRRFRDGGEVHHLVFFQQQVAVAAQLVQGGGGRGEAQGGEPCCQGFG